MHKDKIREMTRSILPSRGRKGARDERSRINRAHRHQVRQALRDVGGIIGYDDDVEEVFHDDSELMLRINDSEGIRKRDLRTMVRDRRGADKISHFVRWCNARTKDIPEEDVEARYFTISGLIGGPADLIREHALGHFLNPEYDFNRYAFRSWNRVRSVPIIFTRDVFHKALKEAFETRHKRLNKVCKDYAYRPCKADDPCVKVTEHKRWVYRYQPASRYGYLFRSEETTYEPIEGSYRPGTLAHILATTTNESHDSTKCENRVLLRRTEDIDRLMKFIFGQSEAWTGRKAYWSASRYNIVKALCKFFVTYDLMYDYFGEGQ